MTSDNDNSQGMTSSQPYLIRAIYEWIVDNDLTPYLMVDASKRGTVVPEDYLDEQGRIILNISPNATSGLLMTNEEITFNARFSGQSTGIVVPTFSVKAIYARENGQGMMFDESKEPDSSGPDTKKRATLEAVSSTTPAEGTTPDKTAKPDSVKSNEAGDKSDSAETRKSPTKASETNDKPAQTSPRNKGKKGPHLKVIK